MAITTLEEMPECRLGHAGSVLVSVWYSELTNRALDALEKHHLGLAERYGKITMVSVVAGANSNPSPEIRERLKVQSVDMQKKRHANLVVVATRGLSAIIARTFLAALSLLSSENMKVCSDFEDCAEAVRAVPGQDTEARANTTFGPDLAAFVALPRPK
ncbi:MAG: hypothetical protein ACOZQL_29860 [Myxococcota bacterium]